MKYFVAADAVVTDGENYLVIKRGGEYQKGTYAFPGGFMEADETGLEAAIRELKEETGVEVKEFDFVNQLVFDEPDRDERGRVISIVCLFYIGQSKNRTPVPMDDADEAMWVERKELESLIREKMMFLDHADMANWAFQEIDDLMDSLKYNYDFVG